MNSHAAPAVAGSMDVAPGYDAVSRLNHWVVAVALIGMVGVGLFLQFGGLEREAAGTLRNLHKATGVLLLAVILWRVGWRLVRGFPPPASVMPAWQLIASKVAHRGLPAGMVLMPLSGIVSSLYAGRAIDVFGLFTLPAQAEIEWLASSASSMHTIVGRAVAILIVLHVAGALKHRFVDRDGTLDRMLKGRA